MDNVLGHWPLIFHNIPTHINWYAVVAAAASLKCS